MFLESPLFEFFIGFIPLFRGFEGQKRNNPYEVCTKVL